MKDGNWAISDEGKTKAFVVPLCKIFEPNPREVTIKKENRLLWDVNISITFDAPARSFTAKEVRTAAKELNTRKTPGDFFHSNGRYRKSL